MTRSTTRRALPPGIAGWLLPLSALLWLLVPALARAQGMPTGEPYESVWGLDSRQVVWVVAQLHLLFGAFVLGVPIFAVILEVVGTRGGDPRYDRLARECTRLLSAAFATTASLGGLLTFVLFGLYPGVMRHIAHAMHQTFYIYGLIFFIDISAMYYYHYSWNRMRSLDPVHPRLARILRVPSWLLGAAFISLTFYLFMWNGDVAIASLGPSVAEVANGAPHTRPIPELYGIFVWITAAFIVVYATYSWSSSKKSFHIFTGVILNMAGIAIMMIANSWGTFMMSPTGTDSTGAYVGDTWGALSNFLWRPLNLHRLMGNVAYGGFVIGAYAAVRFLTTKDKEDRAYYDWMGYVGNFIGISGLLLIPFAGYYLGREIYSFSPTMGNDAMGGFLSWNFVIQAVLIGMLFVGANFYLWSGMERIEGAERYRPYVKYILAALSLSFLVWVIPHNLPLSPEEAAQMGTQYHPVLKYLGLMPAKNAAVNFILLSTYWSFMLYRRANKGEVAGLAQAGIGRFIVPLVMLVTSTLVALWAAVIFRLEPSALSLDESVTPIFHFHAWLLVGHIAMQVLAVVLAFRKRGKIGQAVLLAYTAITAVGIFGASGFFVLKTANPFLRHLAVCQVLLVLTSMILVTAIDVALFRGARTVGRIRWGAVGARPQYALILLCVTVVITMGLMGYIHSGVRQDWHFYMAIRDVSPRAQNPGLDEVGYVVALITVVYFAMISFVFWLANLGNGGGAEASPSPVAVAVSAADLLGEASDASTGDETDETDETDEADEADEAEPPTPRDEADEGASEGREEEE